MKRVMSAAIGAVLAAGLIAAAVPAWASPDPVTGGKSVLKLDPDTAEGLADMSIGVQTTGAGKDGKRGLSFPIKGGAVKKGPRGEVDHKGGVAFFTEGGPSVKFTQLIVKIGAQKTKVFAKSEHSAVRLMDLDLSSATISGAAGRDLKIKNADATLGKQGAQVLSDTFAFPFRKGIPIGTLTIKATLGP